MNRFMVNGSALNGAVIGLVLATANFACAATVSPIAVRVVTGSAQVAGQATVVGNATYIHSTPQCTIAGSSGLFPGSTHTHNSLVTANGSSDILAYVLREVSAASSFTAGVNIIAVVASTQGVTNASGTAQVTAQGTRVQPGTSHAQGVGSVVITTAPTLIRIGSALIACTGATRAEHSFTAALDGVQQVPSYGDVVGSANVLAEAVCYRIALAALESPAISSSVATIKQMATTTATGSSVVLVAEPYVKSGLASHITGNVGVVVTGVLRKVAVATLNGTGTLTPSAVQRHKTNASLTAQASVLSVPKVTQFLRASCQGSGTTTGTALRTAYVTTNVLTSAQVTPRGVVRKNATAAFVAQGQVVALPDTTVRIAVASIDNQSTVTASANIVRYVVSVLDAGASITPAATRIITNIQISMSGSAVVYVDTISNPEAIDPEDRTFIRIADTTDFIRPFIEVEFRRAA
jgi:hypothetical protein